MIFRFSLYGFLKNLRIFEAFLLLALLDRGLDFLAIGSLIAVREVAVNVFEIPSGALADGIGRKRCMVFSMAAYVVAYLGLGLGTSWWFLAAAMIVYGLGDAFRSGTHKALIYTWLRQQGRAEERTRVYGYTRSWSKIGSAASALVGGGLLLAGTGYRWVFLASAIPAVVNLVNLATYPSNLDTPSGTLREGWRDAWSHLGQGLKAIVRRGNLRRLVVSSVAVEGGYKVAKDYLQPLLQGLAVGLPLTVALSLSEEQRTGVVVALVSAALYLLASAASRRAHVVEEAVGDADRAASIVAFGLLASFALLAVCLLLGQAWLAALLFVGLAVGENLWRPIHIGRFDRDGDERQAATTLSVDAQATAAAGALLAPLIGALVDQASAGADPVPATALWPVALLGLPLIGVVLWRRRQDDAVRSRSESHGRR